MFGKLHIMNFELKNYFLSKKQQKIL